MFDLSRLSLLALQADQVAEALRMTQEILNWTSEHGTASFWDPGLIHYANYQVLKAGDQLEQAQAVINEAYDLLQTRAQRISNAQLRGCFMEEVKINQLIVQAYQS
jgi:hypothetical protein